MLDVEVVPGKSLGEFRIGKQTHIFFPKAGQKIFNCFSCEKECPFLLPLHSSKRTIKAYRQLSSNTVKRFACAGPQSDVVSVPNFEFFFWGGIKDLLSTFIVVDLVEEGVMLRFEPRAQRLHSVEVYELTRLLVRYCGAPFAGPDILPTFALIYGRFGPSFPGNYNPNTHLYYLDYPVRARPPTICFFFASSCTHGHVLPSVPYRV